MRSLRNKNVTTTSAATLKRAAFRSCGSGARRSVATTPRHIFKPNLRASSLSSFSLLCQSHSSSSSRSFHASTLSRSEGRGVIPFLLTDVGEGIAECEVMKWFVEEGQSIDEFDPVCEIQSDKATLEVTSRYKGVVTKLYHKVGDMAKVGQPLIDIDTGSGAASSPTTSKPSPSTPTSTPATSAGSCGAKAAFAPTSTAGTTAAEGPVLATPAVRRIAKEFQVDLHQVRGTGREGRVLKEDILNYLDHREGLPSPTFTPFAAANTAAAVAAKGGLSAPALSAEDKEEKEVPIKGLQRTMVKTMTAAASVPLFGYGDEICMDALTELRDQLRPVAKKRGIKLSYMPLILKATSLALTQYPVLNSSIKYNENGEPQALLYKRRHNLGVAMDTPGGLLVPNVKHVQRKSIFEIAAELNRLQVLGKEGKLGKEDLLDGTFTLSNIGSIGGTYCSPIVLPPEVAIGALGRMQVLPRFVDEKAAAKMIKNRSRSGEDEDEEDEEEERLAVVPKRVMAVVWSADHRVIDGATMANFSNLWKHYLEQPSSMLLDMA
ncbi:Dihydrolipoamide acetyltransferase component of pyruvate dehydrogenase complex [Balamuthia mandrillaris]